MTTMSARIADAASTSPAQFPDRATIPGRHVTLHPLDPAQHTAALFESLCGPANDALWTHLKAGPFPTPEALGARLRRYLDDTATRAFWTIFLNASGRAVGLLALCEVDLPNASVEVGPVVFGPEMRRTRAATEAVYLLARCVFEEWGFVRFVWSCDAANGASVRAAERFGFRYEGTWRGHFVVEGKEKGEVARRRDTAWWSMMRGEEWCGEGGVRAGFEAWLEDGNFGEDGGQRRGLKELRRGMLGAAER